MVAVRRDLGNVELAFADPGLLPTQAAVSRGPVAAEARALGRRSSTEVVDLVELLVGLRRFPRGRWLGERAGRSAPDELVTLKVFRSLPCLLALPESSPRIQGRNVHPRSGVLLRVFGNHAYNQTDAKAHGVGSLI